MGPSPPATPVTSLRLPGGGRGIALLPVRLTSHAGESESLRHARAGPGVAAEEASFGVPGSGGAGGPGREPGPPAGGLLGKWN